MEERIGISLKKNILFVCYGLGVGGIEKCLVNLINKLDKGKYSIDVLPLNPEYDLKNQITGKINILDAFQYSFSTMVPLQQYTKEDIFIAKCKKIFKYFIFRINNKLNFKPWLLFKGIDRKYDIAIAYSQNGFSPYYVIDKISANKKYLWYHNGSYNKDKKSYKLDKEYYSKFNNIIAVSQDCKNNLERYFPEIKENIIILNNVYNYKEIILKSKEKMRVNFDNKDINIVTVGRLTKEKGADLALEICYQLVKRGYHIHWYWIGDGNQFDVINNEIEKKNMTPYFTILGNDINPYSYMANCDIYVQPSYYEAYCTTTIEARTLAKSIVVTDVGGMREQFIDKKTCLIVPIDENEIFNAIKLLIENPNLRQELSKNIKDLNFESNSDINEYNKFFEV